MFGSCILFFFQHSTCMSSFFIWLILGKYFYCMSSIFGSDLTEAEQWGFSCHVVLTWHQAPGPAVVPKATCSTFTATLIGIYCSLSPFYRWESGMEKWSNWDLNPGNSAPKSMFLTAILCSLSGGGLLWKLGKFRDRGNSQWVHSLQGGARTTFWVRLRLAEQTGPRTRSRESSDGQCPALEAMLLVHLHEASATFLSPLPVAGEAAFQNSASCPTLPSPKTAGLRVPAVISIWTAWSPLNSFSEKHF